MNKILHAIEHGFVDLGRIEQKHSLVNFSISNQNSSISSMSQSRQTICLVYQTSIIKDYCVKLVWTFLKDVLSERKSGWNQDMSFFNLALHFIKRCAVISNRYIQSVFRVEVFPSERLPKASYFEKISYWGQLVKNKIYRVRWGRNYHDSLRRLLMLESPGRFQSDKLVWKESRRIFALFFVTADNVLIFVINGNI